MNSNPRRPGPTEPPVAPDADLPASSGAGADVRDAPPDEAGRDRASEESEGSRRNAARAPAQEAQSAESLEDYKDRWLRAVAELQNFRRRAVRDTEEARRIAEERVMLVVIAAIDDLERALESAREAQAPEAWTGGVQLVVSRLTDDLGRHGVVALHPIGEPFDPAFHEAILEVDAPQADPGHVVEVVLRGYRRGNRALRPARVVVARRPPGSEL